MLLVDTVNKQIEEDDDLKYRIATTRLYKKLTHNRVYLDQLRKDDVLSHGAITNEYIIKKHLQSEGVLDGRYERSRKAPNSRKRDLVLHSDRRLMLFSYTPDTFSMILVPMIAEK